MDTAVVNMKAKNIKAITLVELVIAITLVSLVILTAGTIEIWARKLVISQDQEAQLLNKISPVMEHICKSFYSGLGFKDAPAIEIDHGLDVLSFAIRKSTELPIEFDQRTDIFHLYVYNVRRREITYALGTMQGGAAQPQVVLANNVYLDVEPVNNVDDDAEKLTYKITLVTRKDMTGFDPAVSVNPLVNPEARLETYISYRASSIS